MIFIASKDLVKAKIPIFAALKQGSCLHADGPPLPLMDFFVHTVGRNAKATTVPMFRRTATMATHLAMASIMAHDVVMGMAAATWTPAIGRRRWRRQPKIQL